MEHYPEIQRRDGTLFFACIDNRDAIAISIERLIDLLDAAEGDCDYEPYLAGFDAPDEREDDAGENAEADGADDEPSLGSEERHPHIWGAPHVGDQTRWAYGAGHDREDDGDDLEPDNDSENSHGWTAHIDQSVAMRAAALHDCEGEGEPDLGWTGHGVGVRDGELHHDTEANGDEDELNGDEGDYTHQSEECVNFLSATDGRASSAIALDMIRGLPIAAKRADAYALVGMPVLYHFERGV